jgi:hypothetical protein
MDGRAIEFVKGVGAQSYALVAARLGLRGLEYRVGERLRLRISVRTDRNRASSCKRSSLLQS